MLASWEWVVPAIGILAVPLLWGSDLSAVMLTLVAALVALSVVSAVHHAEVIAARVGEPFGSLILAVAVTVIEVGLILTLMLGGSKDAATLARDTVFSAVIIACAGICGLCLVVGTIRGGVVAFNAEGSGAAVATLAVLGTLTLIIPNYTTSIQQRGVFSGEQLATVAALAIAVYGLFVITQTLRHRTYFLPVDASGDAFEVVSHHSPSRREALRSVPLLVFSLVGVVGLAKVGAKSVEGALDRAGLPPAALGVLIALVVLAPECAAAVRAARRGLIQVSINLALGSVIAAIGLTIPAVALASVWVETPLVLGLSDLQIALFVITILTTMLTVVSGRATLLDGGLHLAIFIAFLMLAVAP